MEKINQSSSNNIYEALTVLNTPEEFRKFFNDLLTVSELHAINQRFEVAKMLRQQKVYTEIGEKTGASTVTISRVSKSLRNGEGGYDMVLDRLKDIQ